MVYSNTYIYHQKKTPNVGKYTSPMHGMRITWRFISHPPPSVWNTSRISKTSSKVAEQTQDVASVKPRWTILSAIQDIGSWQFCEHDLFGHGWVDLLQNENVTAWITSPTGFKMPKAKPKKWQLHPSIKSGDTFAFCHIWMMYSFNNMASSIANHAR